MRTPMTVVRLDCTAALSAALKACSVSTTTPSAPKDCASFSQSTPPSCTPCRGMPLISCLTRIRPISRSSNTKTMIGRFSRWAVCNSATVIRKPPSPVKATTGRSG